MAAERDRSQHEVDAEQLDLPELAVGARQTTLGSHRSAAAIAQYSHSWTIVPVIRANCITIQTVTEPIIPSPTLRTWLLLASRCDRHRVLVTLPPSHP